MCAMFKKHLVDSVNNSQSPEQSRDSCVSWARQRKPQYPTTGHGQTRLNFLSLHFLLFRTPSTCPLRGSQGEQRRGGRKGGTTLGTPFPSDPSPYYLPDCESETKQQQRLISCGFPPCAYYVYWKDHYAGWTTCRLVAYFTINRQRPFLVIPALYPLHKSESQLSKQGLIYIETPWLWQNYISDLMQQPHTVIWCALKQGFCEIIHDNVLKCIKLKVSTLWLSYD